MYIILSMVGVMFLFMGSVDKYYAFGTPRAQCWRLLALKPILEFLVAHDRVTELQKYFDRQTFRHPIC
jgi:hypothetical protein